MENRKSVIYLEIGFVSFLTLLLASIFIRPAGLGANSGISYYGAFGNTLLPYSLAFLTESVLVWRAASIMAKETKTDYFISLALKIFAILFIAILVTPHNVFGELHKVFGSTLFSLQLVMGTLLTIFVFRDWLNVLLIIMTFLSGLASLVYLYTPQGYMIQAQIIFQVSIWLIFIRSFLSIGKAAE